MRNFQFLQQQDFRSIYQFWKQPTSIPYSLFFAVKNNLLVMRRRLEKMIYFVTPRFSANLQ